jgi:hypothetical protein
MTDDTGQRSAEWWLIVTDQVEPQEESSPDAESELPDPWGDSSDSSTSVAGLTDEQRAVLSGFEDQPAVPRLRGTGDESDRPEVDGTGKFPGDSDEAPS